MQPPVLRRVLADEIFNRFGVLGRKPRKRVVFVRPLVRRNIAVSAELEIEAVAGPSAVADHYGDVVGDSQQSNALVRAGLATKEVHKDAFLTRVLIGDKTQGSTAGDDFVHELCRAFFVNDGLAETLPHAVQIIANELVVQRPSDAVDIEAEQAHHIADDFEVAVVAGDHHQAFVFFHHPFCSLGVLKARVGPPVAFLYESGCEQHIDSQHGNVLETAPARLPNPPLAFFGEAGAKVIQSAFAAAVIAFPQ